MTRVLKNKTKLIFIFSFIFIFLIIFVEYKLAVDKEIIAISIPATIGFFGYLISHFLEAEKEKRKEKQELYKEIVQKIRVLIKQNIDEEAIKKELENFENTYYQSWAYFPSSMYTKLINYLEARKKFENTQKTDKDKKELNEKLNVFMQSIREDLTPDKKIDFIPYNFQIKK